MSFKTTFNRPVFVSEYATKPESEIVARLGNSGIEIDVYTHTLDRYSLGLLISDIRLLKHNLTVVQKMKHDFEAGASTRLAIKRTNTTGLKKSHYFLYGYNRGDLLLYEMQGRYSDEYLWYIAASVDEFDKFFNNLITLKNGGTNHD